MIQIDKNTLIKDLTVEQFRTLIADAYLKEDNVSGDKLTIEDVKNAVDKTKLVRYPIGKTAEALGISYNTLKKHTNAGKIKCNYSKRNNRPSYLGTEILKYYGLIW